MNANATYSIGKDHNVCEDYALAYSGAGLAYAILSDGCSSSPDVDFGARCLAMSAKRELRLMKDPLNLGNNALLNAQRAMDIFPYLSPQFLDATLLVAFVKDKVCQIAAWGDGAIIARASGRVSAFHIQLTSGAPDYLSYQLDPLRKQAYEALENNKKILTTWTNGVGSPYKSNPNDNSQSTVKVLTPFVTTWEVQEGDIIAVVSDGINSFRKADNTPIPWTDLIDEFTAYKTTEGEFVLRRIAAFKRKCLKEGTIYSDDISVAAIVI